MLLNRFVVVANLPYQISTSFVEAVIETRHRIERCIVMGGVNDDDGVTMPMVMMSNVKVVTTRDISVVS